MNTPLRFAIFSSAPPQVFSKPVSHWDFQFPTKAMQVEQVCKPNSVLQPVAEVAIIHLAQPLPAGSSDLPGGRSSSKTCKSAIQDLKSEIPKLLWAGSPVTPPYLVLHCEEFAWPRVSPRAPVRSYIKPHKGAAPFHPSPPTLTRFQISIENLQPRDSRGWLVYFLLHLSSPEKISDLRSEI